LNPDALAHYGIGLEDVRAAGPLGSFAAGISDNHRQTLPGQLEPEIAGIIDREDRPIERNHPAISFSKEAQMRKRLFQVVSPRNGEERLSIRVK
jgi:hypothetical protein